MGLGQLRMGARQAKNAPLSLSWFALACFLAVLLLSTKGTKYSNYQGSIPNEFLLSLLTGSFIFLLVSLVNVGSDVDFVSSEH